MRHFTARRLAFVALVPALLALSVIPGCSNQGEGDRCGSDGITSVDDNNDCDSGLVCSTIGGAVTKRCCYADRPATDSRCLTGGSTSATANAGATSTGGSSGTAGGGGASGAMSTEAGAADAAGAAGAL
ncbi:MAG: hypothetical protein ABI488_15855 [Polyangiaceae bacterium]